MGKLNVAITGSQGRIGKIIMTGLSRDFNLWGLDRSSSDTDAQEYTADISDQETLSGVVREIHKASGGIDALVHLAADSRVDASWESVLRNNIIGTRNVYEAVRREGVKKVVFASTNHVTGGYEKDGTPQRMIRSSDPVRPNGYYATSKLLGEALARQYWELHEVRTVCLRIGSVLPDDDPTKSIRTMKTWLSHRDLVQLVRKSIEAAVDFGIYYGVSDNTGRFWDKASAEAELGYSPADNADSFMARRNV